MSHHSQRPLSPEQEAVLKGLEKQPGRVEELHPMLAKPFPETGAGPTGQFPDGKVSSDDEGEIRIAIGSAEGKVFIDFGKTPIRWVGFTPAQAIDIAQSLVNAAYVAQQAESVVVEPV